MKPLTELIKGLEILEPFLKQQGFKFENFINNRSSGGQFTIASYINGQKRFIIGYRFSIGELGYQYDKYKIGHEFYLDHLGFSDKKQFPDFQSDDKIISFRHILHDFKLIQEDFFIGSCNKLIEASQLQDKIIEEYKKKSQEEYNSMFDNLKIEQARQKFKEKAYNKCLELYNTVEHKTLLKDFDKKIIIYCKKNIKKDNNNC